MAFDDLFGGGDDDEPREEDGGGDDGDEGGGVWVFLGTVGLIIAAVLYFTGTGPFEEETCIQNAFGAEFCGQDAVDYWNDLKADERQQKAEDRKLLRQAIQDERELAQQLGEDPEAAGERARAEFEPSGGESAADRRSRKVCADVYREEGG